MRRAEARRTDSMSGASSKKSLRVVTVRESTRRKRKVRPRRYVHPVNDALKTFDPIHYREGRFKRWAILFYFLGAAVLHGIVLLVLTRFEGDEVRRFVPEHRPEKVTFKITEPKITSTKPTPVIRPEPAVQPEPAPQAVKETPPQKVETKQPVKQRRAPQRVVADITDVPVDPVNIPDKAPTPTRPVRRVVGISFESTVKGGNGPAFAVGNTRMGTTGERAENASDVKAVRGTAYRPGAKKPNGNQVATSIPTAAVSLVKPKRLASSEPVYPKLLKAQGIEGNVAVLIRIDTDGKVTSVKVVKGSGYPEFDEAAKAAALKERYSPAVRGSDAIEYTLKYTYRFRVKNQ